jgi:hypothetical protein
MKPVFLGLILLTVVVAIPVRSEFLDQSKIDMIQSGMEYLMDSRWDSAAASFSEIKTADSADPAYYLFTGLVLLSEMTDAEDNFHDERFKAYMDSVKILSEIKLDSCTARDSAVGYLYLGHAHAYKSLYDARFGSSYSALREGLKAKGDYRRGLKADSTLYDIYLGLGSYHYWKTVKAGLLRTFGFFSNEREEGIAEIELAIDSSLFSASAAKSALIWIMLNEKQYDSALTLASPMYFKYSNSNSFIWPIAEAFYKKENFEKAAEYYKKLFERLQRNPGNFYNLIESAYWLFKSYHEIGKDGQAYQIRNFADSVYNISPERTRKKQRKKIWEMNHHRW